MPYSKLGSRYQNPYQGSNKVFSELEKTDMLIPVEMIPDSILKDQAGILIEIAYSRASWA